LVAISFKAIKEGKPSLDTIVEEMKEKLNLGIGSTKVFDITKTDDIAERRRMEWKRLV